MGRPRERIELGAVVEFESGKASGVVAANASGSSQRPGLRRLDGVSLGLHDPDRACSTVSSRSSPLNGFGT
jgi:hypothetical protein